MKLIILIALFSGILAAQELPDSVRVTPVLIAPTEPNFRLPEDDISILPLLVVPTTPGQKVHILSLDIEKPTDSRDFLYEPFSAKDMVSPLTLGLGKSNPLLGQILTVASTAAAGVLAYQHISKYGFYSRKKLETK